MRGVLNGGLAAGSIRNSGGQKGRAARQNRDIVSEKEISTVYQ